MITAAWPGQITGQGAASVRDSVRRLVSSIAVSGGAFGASWAVGDFSGDRTPFVRLDSLFATQHDSVLYALVDCFTDTLPSRVRYKGRPVVRGAVSYLALRNLVYRETDPEDHWPGNIDGALTLPRLRAAQAAWREAIRRGWWSPT